jgi:hypothetical protein
MARTELFLPVCNFPGPALQSVTCTGAAGCACTVLPVPSDNNGSGTYVLSGTAFIATPADGTPLVAYDYCTQGNTCTS